MTVGQSAGRDVTDADIVEAAKALGALGASGSSALRILATLCNPAVSAAEVARLVNHEPGLAARVLRVANSAFYGLTRTVSTIDRAVVVLGLDAVRGVAAAACLERTVPQAANAALPDMALLLRHSVATAAAAEGAARLRHRALSGEAFIAGLLHDFGVTVQLRLNRAGVGEMLESMRAAPDADFRSIEARGVHVAHERCAAVVFEAWQLPASLIEAVRRHHEPLAASEPHRALAALVYLGDWLSVESGLGFPMEPAPGPGKEAVMRFLGLDDTDLGPVTASLVARTGELQRALAGA